MRERERGKLSRTPERGRGNFRNYYYRNCYYRARTTYLNKTLTRWSMLTVVLMVVIRKRDSRRKMSKRATISTGRRRVADQSTLLCVLCALSRVIRQKIFFSSFLHRYITASSSSSSSSSSDVDVVVVVEQPFFFGRLRFPNISIRTWQRYYHGTDFCERMPMLPKLNLFR